MKYKVIKSQEQYDQYCAILEQLLITSVHEDEIELLTLLIESWDRDHNSTDDVDNVTMLRSLMQEHGLREVDIADIVGVGRRLVLEVLNKKRALPPGMARVLAQHFKVVSEIFEYDRKQNRQEL
jgi:HTH-type transcriptional regulator / antitoxin HigA